MQQKEEEKEREKKVECYKIKVTMTVNSLTLNIKENIYKVWCGTKPSWKKENVLVHCLCRVLNVPNVTVDTFSGSPLCPYNVRSIINFNKSMKESSNPLGIPKNVLIT